MMGQGSGGHRQLFYSFNLDDHVPADHLLRGIGRCLDLGDLRRHLAPFYSHTGRPSIDPELMVRMLIVGYSFGIRSERRLCEEVHLNLGYRWFCRLGLEDTVPDHSTFSKNRHGRFRESEAFRQVFESVVERCMKEGTAVGGPAFYAYSTNCLIDVQAGIIVDVEATPALRTAEINSTRTMIERVERRFDLKPERLIGDMAYGAAPMLGWLVEEKQIAPHIPVWDKSEPNDGTFGRSAFTFDAENNRYICPAGKLLKPAWRSRVKKNPFRYRASQYDCEVCPLKPKCCPNMVIRKIDRSPFEPARDVARALAKTEAYRESRKARKKVEMLFAHLKRILKLDRLRLRGPNGAHDEFLLAAIAQNLRRMAKRLMFATPEAIPTAA
jgi:transposase